MSKGMQDYLLWAVECDGNQQRLKEEKKKKASEKVKEVQSFPKQTSANKSTTVFNSELQVTEKLLYSPFIIMHCR